MLRVFALSAVVVAIILQLQPSTPNGEIHATSSNSWAIVIGSSSGLGFEYARSLARGGFNCIVTSRSTEGADTAVQKLTAEFPGRSFHPAVVDLTKPHRAVENVSLALKGKQLSVGVLSASIEELTEVNVMNAETLHKLTTANTVAFSLLAQQLVGVLNGTEPYSDRKYLIGCSSISSFYEIKGAEVYCATRAFQSLFFKQLSSRVRHKREQISQHPNLQVTLVETSVAWTHALQNKLVEGNATKEFTDQVKSMAYAPDEFVEKALRRVFGGAEYVLLGRFWWIMKFAERLGFSASW
jgi:short-subunit dehydrogenase